MAPSARWLSVEDIQEVGVDVMGSNARVRPGPHVVRGIMVLASSSCATHSIGIVGQRQRVKAASITTATATAVTGGRTTQPTTSRAR